MNREQCYEIGYVIKSHGLHGEVLVQLDVDDPSKYDGMESTFIEINSRLVPFFIESFHLQGRARVLIKFEDIERIEDTQAIKGKKLFLPVQFLPKLEEGEFYLHDIIDYQVVDKEHGSLGTITCFHTETAQTLLEMEYQGHEILFPMIDEVVLKANHADKVLHVNLPNGLLEVYLEDTNEEEKD
jgi:16S rRNA processing protein RimM